MNNMWLSTLPGAIPIVVLLGGIGLLHMSARVAAGLGLLTAVAVAILGFGMPAGMAGATAVYGAAYGLMPIGWIILNVILLDRLTEATVQLDILRDSIAGLTSNRRLQLLFIAFPFGAFLEGAAGFGTPVAVTGADITQYTTFHTGLKRAGDRDGPEEFHIVLVDNGRSRMLATGLRDMLRCIRCGACMNHCVVYRQIGGHAYGVTYPGPMGAVLTPALEGVEKTRDLPHACTLNGRCQEVCRVGIPLPTLLRGWRDTSWKEGLVPGSVRAGLWAWRFVAERPRLSRMATAAAVRAMRLFGRRGWIARMPGAGGWTDYRDLPAPAGRTLMEQMRDRRRGR